MYILVGIVSISILSLAIQPPRVNQEKTSSKIFVSTGEVSFISKAPLETIKAKSDKLKGVVSKEDNTFAFSVDYISFVGFNSPLQQEHFSENFMEADKYSTSTFTGRIIEKINWNKEGNNTVRVKGVLNIHGIKQERILNATVDVDSSRVLITSEFKIEIAEHNITIPKIVHQKIAEQVTVSVSAVLKYTD